MNVGTDTIQRVVREKVIKRNDTILPTVWVETLNAQKSSFSGSWLCRVDAPEPKKTQHETPVLIMLNSFDSPSVTELLAHGQAGARVYVLAPVGWGQGVEELAQCPTVLIRRTKREIPVSGVHTPLETHLWMGAMVGGVMPWRLQLDTEQAKAFRQIFLRLFWHDAIDEGWTGGRSLQFRTTTSRPFDIPELPYNAPVRLAVPGRELGELTTDTLAHFTTGIPPNNKCNSLWIPPNGTHHNELAHLAHDGTHIKWENRDLPDMVTDGKTGTILLPGISIRLRVELTNAQAEDILSLLQQPSSWNFQTGTLLNDYTEQNSKLWLNGATEAHPIKPEQIIVLGDVQAAELRGLNEVIPSNWPEPKTLSLTVRYCWKVLPPSSPDKASKASLVEEWEKVDATWHSRLAKIRKALETAEAEQGRIGNLFTRLTSAMLGFGHTNKELLDKLNTFENQYPSSESLSEVSSMFAQLLELEEKSKKFQSSLKEAERKASEEEEREKQEAKWQKKTETAQQKLPILDGELEECLIQREELTQVLDEAKSKLKSIPKPKKGKQKSAKKDLVARKQALSDDLVRLDKKIKRIEGDKHSLEQQISSDFLFSPTKNQSKNIQQKKKKKGRFIPSSNFIRPTFTLPSDILPKVGQLQSHHDNLYLVITQWKDLKLGEQEAIRLRAKLVTQENS